MTPDAADPPPTAAAAHLAQRFASDAQALRRRAEQLDAARPPRGGAKGGGRAAGGGPDSASCRLMADACDRAGALFASATDEAALEALIPLLERVHADERSPDARHVYAGALARLRQALGDDLEDDDDEEHDDDA